jgi:alkane 1-monooxygenase
MNLDIEQKNMNKFMSKLLLMSTLYMHFFIEHNRGHHKNVSTPLDPATSRLNENFYTFWPRTVIGGWMSAWHLESHRLKKMKQNFGIQYIMKCCVFKLYKLLFVAAIYVVLVGLVLLGFIASSIIGFTLLEIVNYIEHYGLNAKTITKWCV